MYILKLFIILLYSVFSHAYCFTAHLTQLHGYIREPYFHNPYSAEVCEWELDLGYYNVLEIRIESIKLAFGDYLYIRDGLSYNSLILVKLYGSSGYRKFTTSTGSAKIYFSRSQKVSKQKPSQFNITYQIKGRCIPNIQASCSEKELSCFDLRYERCDSIWNCPISGKDEENCYSCKESEFMYNTVRYPCSEILNSKCYMWHQRCDGIQDCDSLADESNCDPLLCGEHNKTFLCSTFPTQCISDSLRCDGTINCRDGSDERNCVTNLPYYESGQFRVIIVSSLSLILFLVMVALGLICICRLHKNRISSSNLTRHRGHFSHDDSAVQHLIDEEMRRQPPPPNYMNAIRFSRPFSSASDLQRLIYPSKKFRPQHKLRSHRNRHSCRPHSNSTILPISVNNYSNVDMLNEETECPKDSDTQLLVPDENVVNIQVMLDCELIDPGSVDVDQPQLMC